jgi:hypothetical protein
VNVERAARGVLALGALAAFAAGVVALGGHFSLFLARAGFALDLEWMEGGLLLHAARYAAGQNIYVPPSVEFIPYLYTPLYPALLALLSKIVPLGYLLGRAVSIASFAAALALLLVAAWRAAAPSAPLGSATGRWPAWLPPARAAGLAVGLGAAGAVAASFTATAGFYDLVRADSLLLALAAAALLVALGGQGYRSAVAAGVLIALAFFTKQTASLVGVSLGVGLLVAHWRRGVVYGMAAALVVGSGLLALHLTSDGWFWTYVFKLHQSHEFYPRRAYIETPLHLFKMAGPLYLAWLMAGIALHRAGGLRRTDAVHVAVALGGFVSGCVGFGTQWAADNAFIPAIYFPAFSVAVWGARLAALGLQQLPGTAALAGVAGIIGLALGLQAVRTALPDSRRLAPRAGDRAAAQRFLERVRALEGPLFIPFHPYYSVLAGHPPHLHRMGVWDVGRMFGSPAGLDQALASGRYAHVILDYKSQPWEWPALAGRYHDIHQFTEGVDAVRAFSGAETSPRRLLARTVPPPPLPAGGARLHDFESGWAGFTPSGEAWGVEPAPALTGLYGRAAADSRRFGPQATGTLRSPPIVVSAPRLRFTLVGDRDPALRVLLVDGAETSHNVSPGGGAQTVEWDVSGLRGRTVTLVLEDRSALGGLAVDEIVSF